MHHGTCVTHVPWCMSWSPTHNGGENVPGIPGACVTRNFTYLIRGPWIKIIVIVTNCWQIINRLVNKCQIRLDFDEWQWSNLISKYTALWKQGILTTYVPSSTELSRHIAYKNSQLLRNVYPQHRLHVRHDIYTHIHQSHDGPIIYPQYRSHGGHILYPQNRSHGGHVIYP